MTIEDMPAPPPERPAPPSDELRIGFVCGAWAPDVGGVETHAAELARALQARGHRVAVLCLDARSGRERFSRRVDTIGGVEVTRVAYRHDDHDALARLVRHPELEELARRWLWSARPDLVHVHHLTGFGLGVLEVLREEEAPGLMTLHDYWPLCPRGQMLRHDGELCERPEAQTCATCIGATWPRLLPSQGARAQGPNGEDLADDAQAAAARTRFALEMLELPALLLTPSARAREVYLRMGLSPERIRVCSNGVEVEDLAREVHRRRALRRADGELHLGVLGAVQPSKGVLELARAVVRADLPGLTLEVHGPLPGYHGGEGYVREVQELARREPRVRVHGPYARAELAGILANLDGLAVPSRWEEVFGLSAREARAVGLPVLVSDVGGLPEFVGTDGGGLVVPARDEEAWVEALRRFFADPPLGAGPAPPRPRSVSEMAAELCGHYRAVLAAARRQASSSDAPRRDQE